MNIISISQVDHGDDEVPYRSTEGTDHTYIPPYDMMGREDRLAVRPGEKSCWGVCDIKYMSPSTSQPKICCLSCSFKECSQVKTLQSEVSSEAKLEDYSPLSLFVHQISVTLDMRKYYEMSALSGIKISLYSNCNTYKCCSEQSMSIVDGFLPEKNLEPDSAELFGSQVTRQLMDLF